MKGKILAVSIVAFAGTALAEEAISIYQLDGSIHCQAAEVTTPAQAAETLEQALVVDAGDWNKMLRKRPDAHGFGIWLFERPAECLLYCDRIPAQGSRTGFRITGDTADDQGDRRIRGELARPRIVANTAPRPRIGSGATYTAALVSCIQEVDV